MLAFLTKRKAKKFGEIAVIKGLATEKDVQEALRAQKEFEEKNKLHKEIGAILTEKGILTPNDVRAILDEQKERTGLSAWFSALFGLSR